MKVCTYVSIFKDGVFCVMVKKQRNPKLVSFATLSHLLQPLKILSLLNIAIAFAFSAL